LFNKHTFRNGARCYKLKNLVKIQNISKTTHCHFILPPSPIPFGVTMRNNYTLSHHRNNFMLLFQVDDALSHFPKPINTHHVWSWTSYHFKFVPLALIFHPFCSQNLSHSLLENLSFYKQTLFQRSTVYLVHWSMVGVLPLSDQHLLWWHMSIESMLVCKVQQFDNHVRFFGT